MQPGCEDTDNRDDFVISIIGFTHAMIISYKGEDDDNKYCIDYGSYSIK